jgi:hypothetical protein
MEYLLGLAAELVSSVSRCRFVIGGIGRPVETWHGVSALVGEVDRDAFFGDNWCVC